MGNDAIFCELIKFGCGSVDVKVSLAYGMLVNGCCRAAAGWFGDRTSWLLCMATMALEVAMTLHMSDEKVAVYLCGVTFVYMMAILPAAKSKAA